jgi:hypothetical protein
MPELAARAEVAKLARELDLDAEQLAFLQDASRDELATLRETISEALFAAQEPRLRRVAGLGKLLPPVVAAKIAKLAFTPVLCGRVAGVLDVGSAVRMAGHLDPEFLAEVAKWIDPARTAEIARALPDDKVIAVGRHLLEQDECITLARFLSVVRTEVALGVAEHASDRQLLHVGIYAEDYTRMSHLVRELPDDRITGVIAAATASGEFAEALTLLTLLEPAQRARVGDLAASAGPDAVNGIVDAVVQLDVWPDVLPLLTDLTDHARRQLINGPATLAPGVIGAAIRAAREHDLGETVLPLLVSLDEQHVAALGGVPELVDPDMRAWLSRSTNMPPAVVDTMLDALRTSQPQP